MPVTPEDMRKQMNKIVDVAKSVVGLSAMIKTQGEKAAQLAFAAKGTGFNDKSYADFQKACKATEVGKGALFKEIKVLMDTCNGLQKLTDQAEKEMKPKKK